MDRKQELRQDLLLCHSYIMSTSKPAVREALEVLYKLIRKSLRKEWNKRDY